MSLKNGVYEQIINKELKAKLKELDLDKYFIGKEAIDIEEAKTILSNYLSYVVKKSLSFIFLL